MSDRVLSVMIIFNVWMSETIALSVRLNHTLDQPVWANLLRIGAAIFVASLTSAFVWRGSRA